MKAVALGPHAAVRHGVLWHLADLFFSSIHSEKQEVKTKAKRWDFFEGISFSDSPEEFDDYVKHLYD